jgi:uncharacterized protein with HEPN domain
MTRDPAHLLDMLNEARLVQQFAQGMDRDALDQDTLRQYAIVHSIMIIGEAARRVSQEFRDEHPEIPWKNIVGMRSQIIHDYDQVSLDIVWRVIQTSIPDLISLIEPLVPPDPDSEDGGQDKE